MRGVHLTVALGALLLCPALAAAGEPDAAEVLAEVEARYADAQTFRGEFVEQVGSSISPELERTGTVLIARGGKARWERSGPGTDTVSEIVVSDGEHHRRIDLAAQTRCTHDAAVEAPAALAFLVGESVFSEHFTPTLRADSDRLVLHLEPIDRTPQVAWQVPAAAYIDLAYIVLELEPDFAVRQVHAMNAVGDRQTVTFAAEAEVPDAGAFALEDDGAPTREICIGR